MRCGLLSPSWNHEGSERRAIEVARDCRPNRVSHLPQPASYLALRCRPPSGDPIRLAALGVLPDSLSAAGRGQRRRSIKMTRTMITIRTTVPMPIYIAFLPWGDACSCRCLRVRLPSPVRINQKPAARATPTIPRRCLLEVANAAAPGHSSSGWTGPITTPRRSARSAGRAPGSRSPPSPNAWTVIKYPRVIWDDQLGT